MVMVSKVHAFMEVSADIQGPGRSFSPHLRPVKGNMASCFVTYVKDCLHR